ncbi:hypothetical protein MRX96_032969 [Rhipicephalus microplus]
MDPSVRWIRAALAWLVLRCLPMVPSLSRGFVLCFPPLSCAPVLPTLADALRVLMPVHGTVRVFVCSIDCVHSLRFCLHAGASSSETFAGITWPLTERDRFVLVLLMLT